MNSGATLTATHTRAACCPPGSTVPAPRHTGVNTHTSMRRCPIAHFWASPEACSRESARNTQKHGGRPRLARSRARRASWMRPRWRSTVISARPVLSGRRHAPALRSGSVNQWRPLTPSLPCAQTGRSGQQGRRRRPRGPGALLRQRGTCGRPLPAAAAAHEHAERSRSS